MPKPTFTALLPCTARPRPEAYQVVGVFHQVAEHKVIQDRQGSVTFVTILVGEAVRYSGECLPMAFVGAQRRENLPVDRHTGRAAAPSAPVSSLSFAIPRPAGVSQVSMRGGHYSTDRFVRFSVRSLEVKQPNCRRRAKDAIDPKLSSIITIRRPPSSGPRFSDMRSGGAVA